MTAREFWARIGLAAVAALCLVFLGEMLLVAFRGDDL